MREPLHDLRGAVFGVRAVQKHSPFFNGRAAVRTHRRFFDVAAFARMFGNPQNFGNDVVTATNEHAASDFQAFLFIVGKIVERRPFHGNARKFDGIEYRKRTQFSRAGHLPYDVP